MTTRKLHETVRYIVEIEVFTNCPMTMLGTKSMEVWSRLFKQMTNHNCEKDPYKVADKIMEIAMEFNGDLIEIHNHATRRKVVMTIAFKNFEDLKHFDEFQKRYINEHSKM